MTWLFSRALVEAYGNSPCSPERVAEYSAGSCLDGELSAQLNGENTPLAYCAPDRMKGFSRLSRFGVTFKPLTDDLGADVLTLYLEAFPVRTLALPEKAQESTVNGQECGATWLGSLGKYDPASRSWKTAQRSFLGDLEESLVTWPRSGMTAGGECWELPRLAHLMAESVFGLLPTPQRADEDFYDSSMAGALRTGHQVHITTHLITKHGKRCPRPSFALWMMGWPEHWTEINGRPSGTDKSHSALQQHGDYLEDQ